jgi:hypothetical protein
VRAPYLVHQIRLIELNRFAVLGWHDHSITP